jgi:hypothetical protein
VDFSVFSRRNKIHSETRRGPFGSQVLIGLKLFQTQKTRRVGVYLKRSGYLAFFSLVSSLDGSGGAEKRKRRRSRFSGSSAVHESNFYPCLCMRT